MVAEQVMLAPGWVALRLSIHVLAAAVFVGGQLVMLGLLPTARQLGGDAPKSLARAFARLSWPAFWVLVATGVWNMIALSSEPKSTAWNVVLIVKIVLVVLAGLGTWLHSHARSKAAVGAWGSVAGTASLLALIAGVMLAG